MRPEEDAFIEKLYQDTFRLLWVYAMSKLNNPALAQEVVQDAFLEAVKNIDKLMSHENPKGWIKNTVKYKVKHAERSFNRYILRFISLDTDIPFEDARFSIGDGHNPKDDSGMSKKSATSYANTIFFDGVSGTQYRVEVSVFAEDMNGSSDSRSKTVTLTAR